MSKLLQATSKERGSEVWSRNEVTFMGNVGRDPEMNYISSGQALTKLSLAVWQGKDKDAMWLNIVIWGELAEKVNEQVQKGDRIEVKGRLTQRKYNDKYYHDVVADSVKIVQTAKERAAQTQKRESDPLGDPEEHRF